MFPHPRRRRFARFRLGCLLLWLCRRSWPWLLWRCWCWFGFTLKHVVCGLNPLEYPLSSRISSVLVRMVHLRQLTVPGLDLRGGCTELQPQDFVGIIHRISDTVDSGRDGARTRV